MAYVKNTWVDQAGQIRYEQTTDEDDLVILTPNYELITEIGTPVNATNMNHIEDGIADCDTAIGQKVSKSGDTMSGSLQFSKIGSGVIALNAIPGGGFSDIQYTMANGLRAGFVRASNVSATERNLQISVCNNSGTPTSNLILRCNNDVISCTFPNTTCCDGQWVDSFHLLSTTTAQGNYEIDVSSFLPSDRTSYDYEIMVSFAGFRNSGDTDSYVYITKDNNINLTSDADLQTNDTYAYVEFDGNHRESGELNCIVIARKNNDKFYFNIKRANLSTSCLTMTKYRRIGTNA
jgi:hypothetical protein